jgi:xanthine dehydrogenase YagT iron-sulfur-binding subunit
MNSQEKDRAQQTSEVTRRDFVGITVVGTLASAAPTSAETAEETAFVRTSLTVNGEHHDVQVDPRVTLLDLLREHLKLTGTKKGCDHGQCGACTVLVNGQRINSCLSLAVMHDGDEITTIEGLAQNGKLHPMQAAFINQDGFQCGYCTPGQICSAVAMLSEVKEGAPSALTVTRQIELTDDEIRERMSGNICRCAAYVGIVAAIRNVAEGVNA